MIEYIATNSSTFEVQPDGTLKEHIATNTAEPDYEAARALQHANIGREDAVPLTYARHAKEIVKAWPDFLKACKAKGVDVSPPKLPALWHDFVPAIFAVAAAIEEQVTDEAKAKVAEALAANTAAFASAQKIATACGVPVAEVLGLNKAEPSRLTPQQQKICKALGITEATFLAAPGERRR